MVSRTISMIWTLWDEGTATLGRVVGRRTKRFLYIYDFGDNWEHEVVVEKIIGGDSGSERLCLAGPRHRPPEDCGGPWGYRRFLEAIRDLGHEEHKAMLESVGGAFDPEAFDIASVNRDLAALSLARPRVQ